MVLPSINSTDIFTKKEEYEKEKLIEKFIKKANAKQIHCQNNDNKKRYETSRIGQCPICGSNECEIDQKTDENIPNGFFCKHHCDDFILPSLIVTLLIDEYKSYKDFFPDNNYNDREKLVSALNLGIKQYVKKIKSHFQTIRFCLDETEKQKDDREGRIYLLLDKKYNIREI